ncbi:MAG: TraB/GumN family protein [bacterium]
MKMITKSDLKRIAKISFGILIVIAAFKAVSAKAEAKNLYFWTLKTNKANIYMLGSIHIANKDAYPLNSKIEKGFAECNNLVLECNTENVIFSEIFKVVSYSDTSSLQSHVSPEVYEMISKQCEKYKIYPESYNKIKPWYTAMLLMQIELANNGYRSVYGLDNYFSSKAKTLNKNILELETPAEQLSYFNYFDSYSDDYIKYSFKNIDSTVRDAQLLLKAYDEGDDETIDELINPKDEKFPEITYVNSKIVDERNANMIKKIEGFINKGGNYFIIAGTAHYMGDKGIIQSLRNKGYQINRLKK